jgi:hypothetical protein
MHQALQHPCKRQGHQKRTYDDGRHDKEVHAYKLCAADAERLECTEIPPDLLEIRLQQVHDEKYDKANNSEMGASKPDEIPAGITYGYKQTHSKVFKSAGSL